MPTLAEQKKNREIWAKALESGEFNQAQARLGNPQHGMCCLGVGCHVLGVDYNPDDAFPPAEFARLVGLPSDEIYVNGQIEGAYEGGRTLVEDNDEHQLTFPEIAKVIRTEPSLWEESDYHQAGMSELDASEAENRKLDELGFTL